MRRLLIYTQATLVTIIGLLLLVHPFHRIVSHYFSSLSFILGSQFTLNVGTASRIIGFLLIYASFFLLRQKRVAYIATLSLLTVALIIGLTRHSDAALPLILLVVLIGWMAASYAHYAVRSDVVSIVYGSQIALLVAGLGFAYGIVSFMSVGPTDFRTHFSFLQAAYTAFKTLFTLNDGATPFTHRGEILLDSLNAIGLTSYVLVFASLFKPVRFLLGTHASDYRHAEAILRQHSNSSEDYFKLWPRDKHFYFSTSGQSFLAYKLSGRTAIILADPTGVRDEFAQLLDQFSDFIHRNGWSIAVINATSNADELYRARKLNTLFVGNEAIIDTATYATQTTHTKRFRYIINRAKKEGLEVALWETVTNEQINALRKISDAWLSRGGRKEFTFFMGYFDEAYLKHSRIMALLQHGNVIAYINIIPSFVANTASIDQFRSLPGSPPITMHFLLSQLVLHLYEQGITTVNIGLSPLSEPKTPDGMSSLNTKLLAFFKRIGDRYYSFSGVEQFKNKFHPEWEARYLYYERSQAALLSVAHDIEKASRVSTKFSQTWLRILIISGIITILIWIQFL